MTNETKETKRMFKAMLADVASQAQAEQCIRSEKWIAQEKIDGHRVMIEVTHTPEPKARPFNRHGTPYQHSTPKAILAGFEPFPFDAVFDGELMDGRYHLFDLPYLARNGEEIVNIHSEYEFRLDVLDRMLAVWTPGPLVHVVPTFRTTVEKEALVARCEDECREGVMFKRLGGKYQPGYRSAHALKFKFRADADVVVLATGLDGKENMLLGAYNGGPKPVEIGRCTARAGDGDKIKAGDVVTVNYAHFSKGGRLVQPTLPRLRTDKFPEECTFDQFRKALGK